MKHETKPKTPKTAPRKEAPSRPSQSVPKSASGPPNDLLVEETEKGTLVLKGRLLTKRSRVLLTKRSRVLLTKSLLIFETL
ncbi:hypothetical protein OROGR_008190 [Orobanche gracilis]